MRTSPIPAGVGVAVAALLSGCAATPATAPSLLPRAIESRGDAEPVRTPMPVAADATLDGQVAARVAAFDAAARAFDATARDTTARVARARGAGEGSDRWLAAQASLGELGEKRAAADAALSDIEAVAIARGAQGLQAYPPLDAAITAAQAQIARQATVDAGLQTGLPR